MAAAKKAKRRSIVLSNNPHPRVPQPIVRSTSAPRIGASTAAPRAPPVRSSGYGRVTPRAAAPPVSIAAETDVLGQLFARIEALENERSSARSSGGASLSSASPLAAGGADPRGELRQALDQLRVKEASLAAIQRDAEVRSAQVDALTIEVAALRGQLTVTQVCVALDCLNSRCL